MKRLAIYVGIALFTFHSISFFAQTVCPSGNCFLDCNMELTPANLFVARPVKLRGTLVDRTGAPYEKAILQIRNVKTRAVISSVQVDKTGKFEFDSVPVGAFRLIAVQEKDGELKRLPLVDQPEKLICSASIECNVKIVLRLHGTDNPMDFCPPR